MHDVPTDGLDPYRRKWARNDLVLLAAWGLGVRLLRVPIDDLRRQQTRDRMIALARHQIRFVLVTVEPLSASDVALIEDAHQAVAAVEHVIARPSLDAPLPPSPVPRWVAPLGRRPTDGGYFDHFVPHGFTPDDADLARVLAQPCEGLVFRIGSHADDLESSVAACVRASGDRTPVVVVAMPRGAEGRAAVDDEATAQRAVAAFDAALAHPDAIVVLDTTMDHDRGYYPRHGLIDRRGTPRTAYRALLDRVLRSVCRATDASR